MKILLTFITILLTWSGIARADLAIIINSQNPIESMNKREVTDLFMGRYVAFPDGTAALPLDHPVDSQARSFFYEYFTGKSVSQINAYWAKLIFSGRATPPRVAPTSESIVKMVAENKNAIAYLDASLVTSEVKVVFLVKK